MKRFAVVAALALACGFQTAQAEGIGPEKAAEMLAHAWMIDNRCNILSSNDRDALTGLVARAELSLAEIKSVKAARDAIGKGRASGTAAVCDQASARLVRDTLKVAKSATAGMAMNKARPPETTSLRSTEDRSTPAAVVPPEAVTEAPAPAKPIAAEAPMAKQSQASAAQAPERKPAKVAKVMAPQPTKKAALKRPTAPAALNGYAATAEIYYRELRCRKKSFPAVNALYAKVLRQHQQAVAAGGKSAVRALLRAAEARASRGSC